MNTHMHTHTSRTWRWGRSGLQPVCPWRPRIQALRTLPRGGRPRRTACWAAGCWSLSPGPERATGPVLLMTRRGRGAGTEGMGERGSGGAEQKRAQRLSWIKTRKRSGCWAFSTRQEAVIRRGRGLRGRVRDASGGPRNVLVGPGSRVGRCRLLILRRLCACAVSFSVCLLSLPPPPLWHFPAQISEGAGSTVSAGFRRERATVTFCVCRSCRGGRSKRAGSTTSIREATALRTTCGDGRAGLFRAKTSLMPTVEGVMGLDAGA